jgi:hypothetical protein
MWSHYDDAIEEYKYCYLNSVGRCDHRRRNYEGAFVLYIDFAADAGFFIPGQHRNNPSPLQS